jgi:predicted lactoylglutathione lyase
LPPRLLFVNLPVADLAASRQFFSSLGFTFHERPCMEGIVCMTISPQARVMLIERDRFAEFVALPVADPAESTSVTLAVSAESRAAVDALAEAALAAGATPAKEPLEYGFMYQRSFHDPDGHFWEVMWMDQPDPATGLGEAATG